MDMIMKNENMCEIKYKDSECCLEYTIKMI